MKKFLSFCAQTFEVGISRRERKRVKAHGQDRAWQDNVAVNSRSKISRESVREKRDDDRDRVV